MVEDDYIYINHSDIIYSTQKIERKKTSMEKRFILPRSTFKESTGTASRVDNLEVE